MIRRLIIGAMLAFAVPVAAQQGAATVKVTGDVPTPLTLTAADLNALPRVTVTAKNHDVETKYEGVWLSEVLKKAGVAFGSGMRGRALSAYVLASASDGYQAVFSLAELDPEMTDGKYLLADRADGKPLNAETGPFRIVVPTDKHGARSIRMVTSLSVVQLRK